MQQTVPEFPTPTFPWIYFPVLQTEAEPAQSLERWPAEREFAGSSPGAFALQTAKQWLNLRLARMTVWKWRLRLQ